MTTYEYRILQIRSGRVNLAKAVHDTDRDGGYDDVAPKGDDQDRTQDGGLIGDGAVQSAGELLTAFHLRYTAGRECVCRYNCAWTGVVAVPSAPACLGNTGRQDRHLPYPFFIQAQQARIPSRQCGDHRHTSCPCPHVHAEPLLAPTYPTPHNSLQPDSVPSQNTSTGPSTRGCPPLRLSRLTALRRLRGCCLRRLAEGA
jgi:hypothetical protein